VIPPIFASSVLYFPAMLATVIPFQWARDSFGGTSILIIVGVVLETMKQIDSQLMMRNYEGFLR